MRRKLVTNRMTKCDLPDPEGPATMAENGCFHCKLMTKTDQYLTEEIYRRMK